MADVAMSEMFHLREYRTDDLEAMVRMDDACFAKEFRFDHRSMERFAEEKDGVSLVAETADGAMAGFAIVHVEEVGDEPVGYVVTLDVGEEFRRRGLASILMREAERRIAEDGASRMLLHVFTGNDEAIRFYERAGYAKVGIDRGFYGRRVGDAFVYEKRLREKRLGDV